MAFSTYQYARLASALIATTSTTTLFTVPASTQYIVKDINITNNAGSGVFLTLLVINGVALLQNITIPANSTMRITGLFVVNATETMTITVATANAISIFVNGQTGQ